MWIFWNLIPEEQDGRRKRLVEFGGKIVIEQILSQFLFPKSVLQPQVVQLHLPHDAGDYMCKTRH